AVLLAIARLGGAPWPTRRQWLRAVPTGVLFFIGGNGFVAIAETSIDSSVAAVVCATMPLWTAVLASLLGGRPGAREWLGAVVGGEAVGAGTLIGAGLIVGAVALVVTRKR